MRNSFRRTVAITLMVTTTHLACIGAAQSALIGTDAARIDTTRTNADGVQAARVKLAHFLERPDVARNRPTAQERPSTSSRVLALPEPKGSPHG